MVPLRIYSLTHVPTTINAIVVEDFSHIILGDFPYFFSGSRNQNFRHESAEPFRSGKDYVQNIENNGINQ